MLTLFHDYTSPASAVAVLRARRLHAEGLPIELQGHDAIGVDLALPVTVDVLAVIDALREEGLREGIALRRPATLPPTIAAHLLVDLLPAALRGPVATGLYHAYWEDGADLADRATLLAVASAAGAEVDDVTVALGDRARHATLRRRMAGVRRQGVGGVPVILASRTLVPGLLDDDTLHTLAAQV